MKLTKKSLKKSHKTKLHKTQSKSHKTKSHKTQTKLRKTPSKKNKLLYNRAVKKLQSLIASDKYIKYYQLNKNISDSQTFTRILHDSAKRMKYVPSSDTTDTKKMLHHGQRKLLLSEIEFITNYYDSYDPTKQKYLLYVGAAEGYHTYYMAKYLFPDIHFILFDARDFYGKLHSLKNVEIQQRYFTDADINIYKKYDNLFFVSDIRNQDIAQTTNSTYETNKIILNDIQLQQNWILGINPIKAMVKFRLPWTPGKTEYLKGTIYLQVWAGRSSTEARLVPDTPYVKKKYDNTAYEEKMFYFNRVKRKQKYKHSYKCYGHSYDEMSEAIILQNYIIKFKQISTTNINTSICKMKQEINLHLKRFI